MKVGLYSPFLDNNLGGGERYLLTVAEYLSQRHQVHLFLNKKKAGGKGFLKDYGQKFHLDLSRVKVRNKPFSNYSRLGRLRLTAGYDAFFYLTDGSFFFSLAKKNIVHFQIPFSQPPSGWFNKLKLKNWPIKAANSYFTKEFLEKRWGIDIDFVHQCGPDLNIFKPLKKKKIILSVGRFFTSSGYKHCKRQGLLVKAFKKMCDQGLKGWTLVLDGSVDKGRDNQAYAQKVKKMTKDYPINIRHELNSAQLVKDYGQAYIYWHAAGYGIDEDKHPEAVEHLGLSTIEAMAAGAAPIVIHKGGQKEIVNHNQNGLFWSQEKELIDKTFKVIRNKALFKRLSKGARKRAGDFSKEKFNQITEEIFGLK